MNSMMSIIGEKLDKAYKKAADMGSVVKMFILTFIVGFVDGVMTWWSIFGLVLTTLSLMMGVRDFGRKLFGKKG